MTVEQQTLTGALCGWASTLRLADVPQRVIGLATSQVLSQLAAVRAGRAHPLGRKLIQAFGPPLQADPGRSAAVLASLGSWLNLDDTAYAGHLGGSTVCVPVAYAAALGLDGAALLTAVIAANECAARITAAATLGPFRGQSALHTHLAGTIAGRLRAESAPARQWVNAFGLAFTMPTWPSMHGFLGSDAKALHAMNPVRAALDACDAAAAGLTGTPDILEHPDGFLARFSTVPLPDAVTDGLGLRWHTDTLSFKVRPGGPGIDAAVDCAIELHRDLVDAGVAPDRDVTRIVVDASLYTGYVGRRAGDHLAGPDTPISALLLAAPYAVATTLLAGDLTVADFADPAVRDARRWALADTVELTHDPDMTRSLLASVAPFGEALRQAGHRAVSWLARFGGDELVALAADPGPPADTFETATKMTPARVTVHLADGRTFSRARDIPIGAAGPDTRARHVELMRAKFVTHGGSTAVADGLADLCAQSPSELARLLRAAVAD
ncbi:MAG TPA: MmgE/PrpD family protein [Pseudonocardiaceae bacterium]